MNGIKIDLSDFARVLYPGILAWLFISWRYVQLLENKWDVFAILPSLVAGVLIYAFYRGVVLYPIILGIEDKCKWIGVPQYEFYRRLVDQMKFPEEIKKKLKKMKWAAACAAKVLTLHAPPKFKDALYSFNSFVHVPFITSFVAFLVFWHDLCRYLQSSPGYEIWWWWIIICAAFLGVGIAFDCLQSNPREAAFLIQHKEECKKFITELAKYYGWKDAKGKSVKR